MRCTIQQAFAYVKEDNRFLWEKRLRPKSEHDDKSAVKGGGRLMCYVEKCRSLAEQNTGRNRRPYAGIKAALVHAVAAV